MQGNYISKIKKVFIYKFEVHKFWDKVTIQANTMSYTALCIFQQMYTYVNILAFRQI